MLPPLPPPPAPPPRLGWAELRQWLELYTTHLLGVNRAASTLDGYRTDVEQVLRLPTHPFATIPSPRVEKRERRVLSEAEYQALRAHARQHSPRDAVVVELLLQTGLRASELCGLRLGDLHFGEPGQPGLLAHWDTWWRDRPFRYPATRQGSTGDP